MTEWPAQNTVPSSRRFETAQRRDHNPLLAKFWEELRTGKGIEKGDEDVEELVAIYTDVETLTSLSEEEIAKIKEYLRCIFQSKIDDYNAMYNTLINDEILLIEDTNFYFHTLEDSLGSNGKGRYSLLNAAHLSQDKRFKSVVDSIIESGVKPMTKGEKIKFFSDPEFLTEVQYYMRDPESSRLMAVSFGAGSRRLTQKAGGYYESNQEFLSETEGVRKRTGKARLRVLDVGSNFGLALKDMKDLDKNIETFNMTISEHPSLFGDHIVRYPAEMMPAEFEESMDLIDSQVAFQYFLYSDIALRNVVKALSVGGVARIAYNVGRIINASPHMPHLIGEQELEKRQTALWTGLKTLAEQGYIDIAGSSPWVQENILKPEEGSTEGFVRLVKNKSTKGVRF